jgi:2-dehydro-3-deoxyglucarate aldolase/4-hydroxy-2-oxoheptanedioate aldolase
MFEPVIEFRRRLDAGEVLVGAGISLSDPQSSEAIADAVDFLWIDQEHSPVGPEALRGHLLAARARRRPGFVRVAASGTALIKPVLDAGAGGIVVPQVRSAEEVRQVVDDCRYPPLGRRGFGPLVPTLYGRQAGPAYVERANAHLFVSVMIETVEAVEAIEAIVAIPGLDSVVLGPWDLSGSFGRLGEVHHPQVVAAMEHVVGRARAAGRYVGSGMGPDPEFACLQASRGVQWLQMGGDCGYLVQFVDQMTAAVRQRLAKRGAG